MTALFLSDRLVEALQMIEDGLEDARRRGSVLGFATGSILRAHVGYRAGRLAEAEADVRHGLALGQEHGFTMVSALGVSFLVDILLEKGALDEAERLIAEAGLDGPLPDEYPFSFITGSRGRVHLARGRWQSALDDLRQCGRMHATVGVVNPAWTAWRSNSALALLGLGDTEQAEELAAEELEMARRFGAPRAIAIACRVLGTVEGGDEGLERMREAESLLRGSEAVLERAHGCVALGAALRRANRRAESRDPLREGLELARRCGATALAERAETELRAAGARPRRVMRTGVDALTPSELRVARMAADGMTNREIAQSLFVTIKTVESQLSSAYRKLDIRSRAELAGALTGDAAPGA